jgi:hypothetical protein
MATFAAPAKLMLLGPTARQLEQTAQEARVMGERMRDPDAKEAMMNMARSYEYLARRAAKREQAARNRDRAV